MSGISDVPNIDMMFVEKERIGGIGTFHLRIYPPSVEYRHGYLRFQAQTYSVLNNQSFVRKGIFTQPKWDTGGAHLGFTEKALQELKRELRK